jgi:hypothetical protein
MMGLVCNQQVDRLSLDGGDHLRPLDEIDGRNHDGDTGPGTDSWRECRDAFGDRRLIEDGGGDIESIAELACPGIAQAGGAYDQRAFNPGAFSHFGKDQARLDGFAETDSICQQHAGRAADHRKRGLELIRPEIDRRLRRRPQTADATSRGDAIQCGAQDCTTRSSPQSSHRDSAGAIEWLDHG